MDAHSIPVADEVDVSQSVARARTEPGRMVRKSPARERLVIRTSRSLGREVAGVILFAFGLFLLLALSSYQASDPSWNAVGSLKTTQTAIANSGGLIGSYLADLFLQVFGVSSFLLPFGLFMLGVLLFTTRPLRNGLLRGLGFFPLALCSAILLSIHGPVLHVFGKSYTSGGLLGDVLSRILIQFFNKPGAYILTSGAFLATLIAVTELSLPNSFKMVVRMFFPLRKNFGPALNFLGKFLQQIPALFDRSEKKPSKNSPQNSEEEQKHPKGSFNINIADETLSEVPIIRGSEINPSAETLPQRGARAFEEGGPKIVSRLKEGPKKKEPKIQEALNFNAVEQEYALPSLDLLHMELEKPPPVDEWSLRMNSKILEKKLLDYGVEGKVVEIHPGPVITMYEFEPAPGVKVGKIVNLSDDLSLSMGGRSVRIVAPIPGKPVVGIEIPNHNREIVTLYEIVGHEDFLTDKGLTLALGKDTEGEPVVSNLAKMPHLLIAGATGTGKSVSINAMICSLLMKSTPDQVRLLMIDPKMVELPVYEGIPHLLLPVITDSKKAAVALKWAVAEMERRLKLLAEAGTRNIENFNKKVIGKIESHEEESEEFVSSEAQAGHDETAESLDVPQEAKPILNRHGQLPYIVVLIDELADLMILAGRDVEESITRLAQMARAVGLHLILATQRPSVDVITGIIKANFPSRISFKVSSRIDSRTILDSMGSESLLGDGDMLFMRPDTSHLQRIHGSYVTESEVAKVVRFLKEQGKPRYEESILEHADEENLPDGEEEEDELYDQAVEIVATSGQASVSYVQRRLRIGYNRAARIVEMMEHRGVVGPSDGVKTREIYLSNIDK